MASLLVDYVTLSLFIITNYNLLSSSVLVFLPLLKLNTSSVIISRYNIIRFNIIK